MALTLTFPNADAKEVSVGNLRQKLFEVTAAASDYTTGGYKPSGGWAQFLGMRQVYTMVPVGGAAGWDAYIIGYDSVNDKLIVEYPTGGGAASPAAVADPAIAAGATPVASAAASGSADLIPGRGKEVANGTDLSGLGALRLIALGN